MSVCGTTNAIFILRQIQEIYLAVSKETGSVCPGELLSAYWLVLTAYGLVKHLRA